MLVICCTDAAATEIYTLSLHDALPIYAGPDRRQPREHRRHHRARPDPPAGRRDQEDRKSTRLNSSHLGISYAVFCLKKKNKDNTSVIVKTESTGLILRSDEIRLQDDDI